MTRNASVEAGTVASDDHLQRSAQAGAFMLGQQKQSPSRQAVDGPSRPNSAARLPNRAGRATIAFLKSDRHDRPGADDRYGDVRREVARIE